VLKRLAVASRALAILKEEEFLLLRILIDDDMDDDDDADRENETDDLAEGRARGEEPRARCIIIIIDTAAYAWHGTRHTKIKKDETVIASVIAC